MTAPPDVGEANASAAPDLGVLFVHGIGNQIVGETVVQFGDPLLRWLREWLMIRWHLREREAADLFKSSKDPAVRDIAEQVIKEASVKSGYLNVTEARVKTADGIPAHSHVEIGTRSDNKGQTKRWILAESCWAQAFAPPTFKALAFWGLVAYPWTNATHYGSQIRRKWSRAYNRERGLRRALAIAEALVAVPFLLIVSVPISIIVVVLLALLLLLAIPPIPSLRAMLLRVQQALAGTLGDCFTLVASPIQRAAIVSHVRRDVDWLISQDCKNIAVVAHSQGAAVAHEALSTGVLKRFCQVRGVESDPLARESRKTLLITFGSGIAKLSELDLLGWTGRAKIGWMPIGGLALIGLSLEFFKVINVIPFVERSEGLGVFCAIWGTLFWIQGVASGAKERPLPANFEPRTKFGCDTKWRDYYASHDPVPNGPLFDKNQSFPDSEEVHNFASMWRDHTTYWLNRDEFVPAVIRDLAELSQLPLLDLQPSDKEKIKTASARRAARVQWLTRASLAIWVVAAVVTITRWTDLPRVGSKLLSQLPLLEKVFGSFGMKEIVNGEFATSFLAEELAGIVAVVVCGAVASQVVRILWQNWTWWDTRALLRWNDVSEWPRWLFFVVTLALVNAGILVSMGLPTTIVATRPPNYGSSFIVYLFAPGFIAGGIMYLWRLMMWWLNKRRENPGATFWPAAVASLMVAPIMALSLIISMGDWYRLGILVGLVVLGCFLIHHIDAQIEAERN